MIEFLCAVTTAQGFMDAEAFLAFLQSSAGTAAEPFAGMPLAAVFASAIVGGLAMNLTPCVLPMVPINLMVIGKSAWKGALYGLGIALAYGAMGLAAAFGGMAFGAIQSNPWFNVAIAVIFVALALALMDVFFVDFSKKRGALAGARSKMLPGLFAFFMGAVSAVLAGACVAPILIAVLLLTAKLSAQGSVVALALPFALGLGMALPWPFAGAGMQVLPKPGAWMKWVNRVFGVIVLCFAAWYARLAYIGFAGAPSNETSAQTAEAGDATVIEATPSTFYATLERAGRPVLVDCWATWCKNCRAMERKTLKDERVTAALKDFTVIRLQAEDIDELRELADFKEIQGLPAFLIFR